MVVVATAVPRADWHSLALHTPSVRILGLAILLTATAFTLWARLALGAMWSAAPAVKQQHKLHTSGPYNITRHPIYTGMLGMLLGSTLLAGAASVAAQIVAIRKVLALHSVGFAGKPGTAVDPTCSIRSAVSAS